MLWNKLVRKNEQLKEEKKELKEAIEELQMKKRVEVAETKHMLKMKEKENDIEVKSRKVELEEEYGENLRKFKVEQNDQLVKLHTDLYQKMEDRFQTELGNLKEVYKAVMERLPNVNYEIRKSEVQKTIDVTPKKKKK